jgi:hypothetical protein
MMEGYEYTIESWNKAVGKLRQSSWTPAVCSETSFEENYAGIFASAVYSVQKYQEPLFVSDTSLVLATQLIPRDVLHPNSAFQHRRVAQRDDVPIQAPRDAVIKYTNTCGGHVLLRSLVLNDFLVAKAIAESGIAPEPIAISSAVTGLPREVWTSDPRLATRRVNAMRLKGDAGCKPALVRAVIYERAGQNLRYIFDMIVTKNDAMLKLHKIQTVVKWALMTIESLEKLHILGFVHNDISAHNILSRTILQEGVIPESYDLVLIDFEFAFFYPEYTGRPETDRPIETLPNLNAVYLSPWQLDGKRSGRREDLFRALEMVFAIITRTTVSIKGSKKDLSDFKMKSRLFTEFKFKTGDLCTTTFRDSNASGDFKKCYAAMQKIESAMDIVKAIPHVDYEPDYDAIKGILQDAIALLE